MRTGGVWEIDRLWTVLACIFFGGLVLLKFGTAAMYAWGTKNMATEEEVIHPAYSQRVAEQKDVDKLAKIGETMLKQKKYYYAALNLKQASDLDSNYRDVAYGWAYATLENEPYNISPQALEAIKTGISRAEKVDPYFEPLLKLKLLVAQVEGDQEGQKAVQDRMALLGI